MVLVLGKLCEILVDVIQEKFTKKILYCQDIPIKERPHLINSEKKKRHVVVRGERGVSFQNFHMVLQKTFSSGQKIYSKLNAHQRMFWLRFSLFLNF